MTASPIASRPPRGVAGWSWRFAVALPLLYYVGRRWFWTVFCWDLPVHSLAREGAALGACLALSGAILVAEKKFGISFFGRLPQAPASPQRPAIARSLGIAAIVLLVSIFFDHFHFKWIAIDSGEDYIPGDGHAWMRDSSHPEMVGSEPLGRLMHYVAYRALALIGAASSPGAVRLSSVAAGAVWLVALFSFAPRIFRGMRPGLAVLLLFVAPSALFFMGYPETTPWPRALAGVYWLAGLRYLALRPPRPPWIETLIMMLAIGEHGMVCFAYGSQLVLIALWMKRTRGASILLGAAMTGIPFALLAALMLVTRRFSNGNLWYGNALSGGNFMIHFFAPSSASRYRFLERRYIMDLFNLWLAACPALPLAIMGLRDLWKTRRDEAMFLGAGLAGTLVLAMFWNASFGMEADIDLLGFFAMPAMICVAMWWSEKLAPEKQTPLVLASASVAWVCCLLPFLQWG